MTGTSGLFALDLRRPLLVATFPAPRRMLSWAPARPGFQRATSVAWLQVQESELPVGTDPGALLAARLAAAGLGDAVAMMTSREIGRAVRRGRTVGAVAADCAVTVGLANAAHVGRPGGPSGEHVGTIDVLAALSAPLSDPALIEAISIAAEARTAAVMEAGRRLPTGLATGTGTDCIVVAAPDGPDPAPYCGLHTEAGQALGAAVYAATLAGAQDWIAGRGR